MRLRLMIIVFLTVVGVPTARAGTCTATQIKSFAKALSEKELAFGELEVSKQRVLLELEHQDRITAAYETQYKNSLNNAASFNEKFRVMAASNLQSAFTVNRTKRVRQANLAVADANRALRTAQTRYDSALSSASRPLSCQLSEVVTPTSTPTPTLPSAVSLEAYNVRTGLTAKNGGTLSAIAGDSINYRWSATGGSGGSSTYRILSGPNLCGWATSGSWLPIVGSTGGELSTVQPCQKGSSYEINYRPQNAYGVLIGEQKLIVVVQ